MSRSPYFYVEKYNSKTKKYELEHPLVWNWERSKRVPADLFPYNGHHDLFSIVEQKNYGYPEMRGIHHGLPFDVCEEIKEDYEKSCGDWGMGRHEPEARWFTYADMYIYCIENPEAESMWEENEITFTPMKILKDRVDAFMEVIEDYDWRDDWSLIRIVYWID